MLPCRKLTHEVHSGQPCQSTVPVFQVDPTLLALVIVQCCDADGILVVHDVVARVGARLVLVRFVLVRLDVARPVLGRLVDTKEGRTHRRPAADREICEETWRVVKLGSEVSIPPRPAAAAASSRTSPRLRPGPVSARTSSVSFELQVPFVLIMQLTSLSAHVLQPSRMPRTARGTASRPLTVISFLSSSQRPTTYNLSGAGRHCSCRAAPLQAAIRASPLDLPAPHAPSRCTPTALARTGSQRC
jgi:hypothetical protein